MNRVKGRHIPMHETFRIGALLAVVGGFLDAYTFILKGGVFANAQTGNIVLLAVNLAQGRLQKAVYYILPIAAFVLGVFITELVKAKTSQIFFLEWEHIIIILEIVLLAVIGLLPAEIPNQIVNVTISFICSIQVNSFRKIHGITYASTMCTGNLRSGTESLFRYLSSKDRGAGKNAAHYFGIIFLFILGAAAGTLLSDMIGEKSIWICCGILGMVLAAITYKKRH